MIHPTLKHCYYCYSNLSKPLGYLTIVNNQFIPTQNLLDNIMSFDFYFQAQRNHKHWDRQWKLQSKGGYLQVVPYPKTELFPDPSCDCFEK